MAVADRRASEINLLLTTFTYEVTPSGGSRDLRAGYLIHERTDCASKMEEGQK